MEGLIEFSFGGKIVSGLSAASGKKKNWQGKGSVELQINWINEHCPEVGELFIDCYLATINVILEKNINIYQWDYVFENVFWLPNCDSWSEKIAFKKCKFLICGKIYNAWIYKPYRSPHRDQKNFVEIISPKINDLHDGAMCSLTFKDILG